jgi:hypothetical protein
MCGSHRRKPASEDNDEEEENAANGDTSSAHAFMLFNLKASAGKYVRGPPVDTEPAITVFTGLASKPDLVEQTVASGKTKHKRKKKIAAHPKKKAAEADHPAKKKAAAAAPPAKKKPAKHAKAKVSSAAK